MSHGASSVAQATGHPVDGCHRTTSEAGAFVVYKGFTQLGLRQETSLW